MALTKRDMAGEIVGAFGRYMPDAPKLCYHIRLNGRFLASEETHLLADRVAEEFTKTELVELVERAREVEETHWD